MEQAKPKLLDRVFQVCLENGIKPELAERYRKCCEHFLKWLKGDGEWLRPESVLHERVEQYVDQLPGSVRSLAFGVLQFLYAKVLNKPGFVLNWDDELHRRLRNKVEQLGHSPKTFKTYSQHVGDFYRFHKVMPWQRSRFRALLTREQLEKYLTYLAADQYVAETTQNGAFHAVLYMAKHLFEIEIKGVDALRAKRPQTLPEVLSQQQVATVLEALDGEVALLSMLGYGAGLRISEACGLRVKDVLFDRKQIIIRCAKGMVDRVVPLPVFLIPLLSDQIEKARKLYERDIRAGQCRIPLPNAFGRKSPQAEQQFCWFWIFPSYKLSEDPKTKRGGRWHVNESNVNRVVSSAARQLKLDFRMHFHVWRHCFATHFLDHGGNIRRLQAMMGHKSLETTMRYTHVALFGVGSELSPLDFLKQFVSRAKPITAEKRTDTVLFPIRQNAG